MDLIIPTRTGPIPLTFLKKEFLATVHKEVPGLQDLENIKNLPLNFVTQLTASNAAFFEDSPIFDSIYTNFVARNGEFRFNDSYKVKGNLRIVDKAEAQIAKASKNEKQTKASTKAGLKKQPKTEAVDRKSTRLNSSH